MNQMASLEQNVTNEEEFLKGSDEYQAFLKEFESFNTSEEKIHTAINFMKKALARKDGPDFKTFWEARKLCLPLFKNLSSYLLRSTVWNEYVELTREGRRLKSLLDEESAFAIEQIEIAIHSLEEEIKLFHENLQEVLAKMAPFELPSACKTLQKHFSYYQNLQQRLNLLNVFATRTHALRKELIKTEMRIRQKNKFFERLSLAGDQIFPVRKELIKEVSDAFIKDVTSFVDTYFSQSSFSPENVRRSVFFFREEIKSLQAAAKFFTLNTQAFTNTRESLSKCWDKLKGMEKELKKEFAQTKQKSQENAATVIAALKEIKESYEQNQQREEALQKIDELFRSMRSLELTHQDVKALKEEAYAFRNVLENQKEQEEEKRRCQEALREEKRREEIEKFKQKMEIFREKIASTELEVITQEFASLRAEFVQIPLAKRERQALEKTIKELRDVVEEKKQNTLLNLSDDDRASLVHLQEMYQQRKERRQEVKNQVEEYRKIIGGSSLDFEKAMEYGTLLNQEREKLEKMDDSIREIEDKIRLLKKQS